MPGILFRFNYEAICFILFLAFMKKPFYNLLPYVKIAILSEVILSLKNSKFITLPIKDSSNCN